jgi:3-oxoadipate enol-lactonase
VRNVQQSSATAPIDGALPLFAHEVRGVIGGPWVTFVPGIGNDRSFWKDQADRLAHYYQVLLFDPWGHGDSPLPPEICTFEDIARGIVALWDHLGIRKSAVVGLGFGGSLALYLAAVEPQRVSRTVALCCRPRQPDDRRDFWRDRRTKAAELGIPAITKITVDRWLSEAFRAAHPVIDQDLRDAMNRTTLAGYQAYTGAFADMDFTDVLDAIKCPVLLVAAEHDHGGGPVSGMTELKGEIPQAELTIISGSGHICVAEAPQAVAKVLSEFLAPLRAWGNDEATTPTAS